MLGQTNTCIPNKKSHLPFHYIFDGVVAGESKKNKFNNFEDYISIKFVYNVHIVKLIWPNRIKGLQPKNMKEKGYYEDILVKYILSTTPCVYKCLLPLHCKVSRFVKK